MSSNGTCTHIKVTGLRCGSPALTGEQFCYFHQNAHRGVRRPRQSRLHPIALIEDEESIQYALMEVINALMRNTIDCKRATLILRALHIAVKNASRVKLGIHQTIRDIPDYAEPTAEHEQLARESELPAVAADPNLPVSPEGPHYWEMQAEAARRLAREEAQRFAAEAKSREETRRLFAEERAREQAARKAAEVEAKAKPSASVGADAFVRPASGASVRAADATTARSAAPPPQVRTSALACPEQSRRASPSREATARSVNAATESKPAPTPEAVPPHNFKPTEQPARQQTAPAPSRKPPMRATQAPKERKSTAHAARHG